MGHYENALANVNAKIRSYWNNLKASSRATGSGSESKEKSALILKKLKKPKVPVFSRHNKHKINRLKDSGWRKSRGWQCNKLNAPKIGYKRSADLRFRDTHTGLLQKIIYNVNDIQNLKLLSDPTVVGIIAKKVGARKRVILLDLAQKYSVPLYIQKRR